MCYSAPFPYSITPYLLKRWEEGKGKKRSVNIFLWLSPSTDYCVCGVIAGLWRYDEMRHEHQKKCYVKSAFHNLLSFIPDLRHFIQFFLSRYVKPYKQTNANKYIYIYMDIHMYVYIYATIYILYMHI